LAIVAATEEVAEDEAAVIGVGVVVATGVVMAGGVIVIGGAILTIPTPVLTHIMILITMVVMGNRQCLHKVLPLRQNRDNSNRHIGTSVRTQRVTTRMLKIARVVG
jgi:hypothetical protein